MTVSLSAAGALALCCAHPAAAQAVQTNPPPPPADLQAQVRSLSAMVQSLSSQVQSLQAQLDARGSAPQSPPVATAAPAAAAPQGSAPLFTAQAASAPRTDSGDVPLSPRVAVSEQHLFSLGTPDGRYSIGLVGVAQFDVGDYVGFHARNKVVGPQELSNGVNARRARIGFAGKAGGDWGYSFIYDAGNSSDATQRGIETAQISYNGFKGLALEIGYSNTLFTIDQSTSSSDLVFTERASPSNLATNFNTGDNRSNAGFRFFGDRYWVGGYLTGPVASSDSHTNVGERLGSFQRAAFQVLSAKDYNLHLGVGVSELIDAPTTGANTPQTFSDSDQPELRIDPTTLLNTGTLGTAAHAFDGGYVVDLETAAVWKSLFWQGEYYHYDIGRNGLADDSFNGAYGQVSWTLTGESHRYNPQAGSYLRIFPSHPFSLKDGGLGAIELAARVSYVDLVDNYNPLRSLSSQPAAVDGGRQAGYSLALNWYPNDLLRFMLDYNHIDFDKRNGAAVAGAPLDAQVGTRFDAISLRSQIVF